MKQNEKFINEYLKNISTRFSRELTMKSYLSFRGNGRSYDIAKHRDWCEHNGSILTLDIKTPRSVPDSSPGNSLHRIFFSKGINMQGYFTVGLLIV